mgnify:CR=1 FL=1|jgi:hypothetical protein
MSIFILLDIDRPGSETHEYENTGYLYERLRLMYGSNN